MRKVFISYRHNTHKNVKDKLIELNDEFDLFINKSVDSGDISDSLSDETIRQIIRDKKLKDSTIMLFIHGEGTDKRKFIDWEIAGSMINYKDSKQNAIIVIDTGQCSMSASNTNSSDVAINTDSFVSISANNARSKEYWRNKLPSAPERLINNMIRDDVNINVIKWEDILERPYLLKSLIEKVYEDRLQNSYDISMPLRRRNG